MENNDMHKQDVSTSTTSSSIPPAADMTSVFDEVTTARLVLRRVQLMDGSALFRVHGDPAPNLYNPYGPHADLAASEVMLRECLDHWEAYGFGIWAVTRVRGSEQIIGFGGVEHQVWRDRDGLNLYYRFTPSAWGQGYATELAQTAVTLARTYLPQWPIVARIRAKNIPSLRTAERAGLVRRPDLDTEHMIFALGWSPPDDPGISL